MNSDVVEMEESVGDVSLKKQRGDRPLEEQTTITDGETSFNEVMGNVVGLPRPGFEPDRDVIMFSESSSPGSPSDTARLMNMVTRAQTERDYFQKELHAATKDLQKAFETNKRVSERLSQQKRALAMLEKDVIVPAKWVINEKERLVDAINVFKGPKVQKDRVRGYGLFADRDYEAGEIITRFGGRVIYGGNISGDYVAKCSEFYIDGFDGFRLSERGRWINEFDRERSFVNCSLGREIRAIVPVKKGEQFFCNYGNDYARKY